jgi:hypothetical protein
MEIEMLKFYPLGWTTPAITFGDQSDWMSICLSIYEYFNDDDIDEFEAADRIHTKELETDDESDYVEGVYLDNKLIGSWIYPFVYNPESYKEINK